MNATQNFMETLKRGKPEALVNEWEPFGMVFDPLMGMTLVAAPGKTVVDPWGVTIVWKEGDHGPMPHITPETKALKDIKNWRDYVKAPDIAGAELDWTAAKEQAAGVRAEGKLATSLMATGLFEQSHYLMGFEDTLVNFITNKKYMHELLDYITDYKLKYIELLGENLKPDVILFHDDWGNKTQLFMRPKMWREFFKERYEKMYKKAKEYGIIVMHHADSYCEDIAPDMVDIGMDIWQGVLPQNDIPKIQKETGGKLILMGGIDAAIVDVPGWSEDEVRAEVRRACAEYVPGGSFIPCLTYGGEGSLYPGVNDVIMDEIRAVSPQYFS